MREPRTLSQLWRWALEQADAAIEEAPAQIHTRTYPRDDSPDRIRYGDMIRGLPFTVPFGRYIDNENRPSPIAQAVRDLYSPHDKRQSLEFEVAWAIVDGRHQDREILRAILGCSIEAFEQAAHRGLSMVYAKTQKRIREDIARSEQRLLTGAGASVV